MIEVGLKCVMREPLTSRCLILLESVSGLEILPIPIGEESANTIHSYLCGKTTEVLSLFSILSETLLSVDNAFPERVVIDGYEDGVFTAKVYIIVSGEERMVDARPSDAVRFALFSKVPIYVARPILFEKFRDKKLCFEKTKKCCE
jgi:bifunctional DNase/RNase